MVAMETRMERYSKYREQIRRMTPEQFAALNSEDGAAPAKSPALPIPFEEEGAGKSGSAPYLLYLSRRKLWFAIKVALLILTIAAFVVWWTIMQGGR